MGSGNQPLGSRSETVQRLSRNAAWPWHLRQPDVVDIGPSSSANIFLSKSETRSGDSFDKAQHAGTDGWRGRNTASAEPFEYTVLREGGIRLLELLPDSSDDDLKFAVRTFEHKSIQYTWGYPT